jgi:hypothetical protein
MFRGTEVRYWYVQAYWVALFLSAWTLGVGNWWTEHWYFKLNQTSVEWDFTEDCVCLTLGYSQFIFNIFLKVLKRNSLKLYTCFICHLVSEWIFAFQELNSHGHQISCHWMSGSLADVDVWQYLNMIRASLYYIKTRSVVLYYMF